MADLKIDKGIPAPPKRSIKKYPFADMKVGDSVLVGGHLAGNARNAAYLHGVRSGKSFTSRTEKDGLRIWRTK
jgi:hypothetical protein